VHGVLECESWTVNVQTYIDSAPAAEGRGGGDGGRERGGEVKRRWRKRPVSVADSPRCAASIIDSCTRYTLTSATLTTTFPRGKSAPEIGTLRKNAGGMRTNGALWISRRNYGWQLMARLIAALRSKLDRFAYRDNTALTKRNAMDDGTSAKLARWCGGGGSGGGGSSGGGGGSGPIGAA
jgi:hypothetical protein